MRDVEECVGPCKVGRDLNIVVGAVMDKVVAAPLVLSGNGDEDCAAVACAAYVRVEAWAR